MPIVFKNLRPNYHPQGWIRDFHAHVEINGCIDQGTLDPFVGCGIDVTEANYDEVAQSLIGATVILHEDSCFLKTYVPDAKHVLSIEKVEKTK